MTQLTEFQRSVLATIRDFVRREVVPTASRYDEADEFPADLVERMRDLGLFGAMIPEDYGGGGMDVATYALAVEELAKGWMSLAGFMNTHMLLADMLLRFGTDEQKQRYLPVMATGELRGGLCITEPDAGTDVQAISTRAVRDGEEYVLNGAKTLITNGRHGGLFAVVCKTAPEATPAYRGISILLAERSPGFNVVRDIPKLGYRGIDTCEITFDNLRVPAANLLGGVEGQGFGHVMAGLELGRINVAARAVGVGRAALEAATQYAQQRHSFGKPIAEHQAIQLKLADMATQLQAAHLLVMHAAALKDQDARVDFEAGMAKLFASEACLAVSTDAMRIHGGYGYTKDLPIERYFRDAPLMIIGEGTNEIQRVVIARNLVKRFPSGDFLHEAAL